MLLDFDNEISELKSQLTFKNFKVEQLMQELFSLKRELAEAKMEYADLYDYSPSAYFTIDNQYIIQTLNFQAAQMLNRDRQSLLDQLFLNYITPHSKDILQEKIQTLYDTKCKQTCEIELRQKDGGPKYTILEATLLQNRSIRLCLIDNTMNYQLKNQNFELTKSLNLINIFQDAIDAAAVLDKELNLTIVNGLFNELFSKIIATKINTGMNLISVLADFPDLRARIMNACDQALNGKIAEIIIENPTQNIDVYYYYKLYIQSILNKDNQKQELIFRFTNLTDYKLEERIKHKQQLEIAHSCRTSAIGEMASTLAHEVNQPLTAIATYSRSCLFIINNDPSHKKMRNKLLIPLEKIAVQAELAGEIIHNMKNFMHQDIFYVEPTNINQLIKDTLSIFHYELLDFKLKISLNLNETLPEIMTNKIHIMQIILNLARNSIEALRSVSEKNPELVIETSKSLNHITIHIRDNGPGIPYEYRNRILDNFFTTKSMGSGIGLGICRTLIEAHGGKLSLQEHDKKGAWFIFTLPLDRSGVI